MSETKYAVNWKTFSEPVVEEVVFRANFYGADTYSFKSRPSILSSNMVFDTKKAALEHALDNLAKGRRMIKDEMEVLQEEMGLNDLRVQHIMSLLEEVS